MSSEKLNSENFDREVLRSPEPVLVDFRSDSCAPCRALSPILDSVAETLPGLRIGIVDVEEEPELARRFRVMSIPTLCLFRGETLLHRSVGLVGKNEILSMLERNL